MELTDKMWKTNLVVTNLYPSAIPLVSSPDKLRSRKVPSVSRLKKKKKRNYEVYAHYLHFLFNPFQTELDLKIDNSCTKKLEAPDVIDIVNRNRSIIKPYCELFDEAMLRCNSKVINNDQALKKIAFHVLDNSSTENKSADYMNQGDIIDWKFKSPLLLQIDEEINEGSRFRQIKATLWL